MTTASSVIVVFRSRMRADADLDAYAALSARMHELVAQHPGFISIENFSTPEGDEVSLERFESEESVDAWRRHPEHVEAQRRARAEFYEWYSVQSAHVVREYRHERDPLSPVMAPKNGQQ
jgi:heme-degrading monooxygenase HmoA